MVVTLDLSECAALGDLICATPTIKKLSEFYNTEIIVVSGMPELFKHNPHVSGSYKHTSVDMNYLKNNSIYHNSFHNVGKKNEFGVELKHNRMDIRQFHAINLGFMLTPDEMQCFYSPTYPNRFSFPEKYVVIHPVQSWATRTWDAKNWMLLTQKLNEQGIYVVSIGKDSSEKGFFNVQKPVFNFEIKHGMNLMNQTNIADCWHILNNAECVVTMDSGILHLAGTTDVNIIQLGSHINPLFRAPYRLGRQDYKYKYVAGSCNIMCGSDCKYGVEEWGNIQGIPPLIKCLEKKETFECHPDVDNVIEHIDFFLDHPEHIF